MDVGKRPDFKNDGIAVWLNKDRNGKPYVNIHLFGGVIKLQAFENTGDGKPVDKPKPKGGFLGNLDKTVGDITNQVF
jgi:hypothetical protein